MTDNKNTYPAEFVEWVASSAYKDIRGKYRVYKGNINNTPINTVEDLYKVYLELLNSKI